MASCLKKFWWACGEEGRWRWSFKSVILKIEKLIVRKVKRNRSFEYDVFEKDYLTEKKRTKLKSIMRDSGVNNEVGTRHLKSIDLAFPYPKPEPLIKILLEVSTNPGDLVLDSFLGSGTTAAVAHKMGRRWIGIELGEHCHTHCIPRLKKVIDGTDQGGISQAVSWKGGGGFRYYRLAPSMLEKDKWGNWIISKEYDASMLTEAMCRHMGFTYAPDETHYWIHGHSTESDYIYVTTRCLTHEQLRAISEAVGLHRTLLICCKAFNAKAQAFDNLTLKKMPQTVLKKCEWGRDDYSLNVAKLEPAREIQAESTLFEALSIKNGEEA